MRGSVRGDWRKPVPYRDEILPPRSSGIDLRADEGSPSHETGFRPACRTTERLRQKQSGQAPSGNQGAARQRVHPEVHHREALQFFACQPRKLDEEARNQETEAVESYDRFGTFALLYQRAHELNFIQGCKIDLKRINSIACREQITVKCSARWY